MGTEAMAVMASAVVPVQAHGAVQSAPRISDERAKVLRERHQSRITAARRVQTLKYPEDKLCFAIVHEFFRLRREGYSAQGEIDDAVAEKFRPRFAPLTGALVQDIVGFFAEAKVRELESVRALNLNIVDAMRQMQTATFEAAPGRSF
jgi:hypothetical protein